MGFIDTVYENLENYLDNLSSSQNIDKNSFAKPFLNSIIKGIEDNLSFKNSNLTIFMGVNQSGNPCSCSGLTIVEMKFSLDELTYNIDLKAEELFNKFKNANENKTGIYYLLESIKELLNKDYWKMTFSFQASGVSYSFTPNPFSLSISDIQFLPYIFNNNLISIEDFSSVIENNLSEYAKNKDNLNKSLSQRRQEIWKNLILSKIYEMIKLALPYTNSGLKIQSNPNLTITGVCICNSSSSPATFSSFIVDFKE